MNKKFQIIAEYNKLAIANGLDEVTDFPSKGEAYKAFIDLQDKLNEWKKKPVSFCKYFIQNNVLSGRKATRKEYIKAMLNAGIARGTADYSWSTIFKKGGIEK